LDEETFFVDFFFGDSRVFFGDLGDLAFLALGDSLFFVGDLVDLVDLAFAALAFFGDVASFLGLEVVDAFLVEDEVDEDETFFVTGFFVVDEVDVVDFFGDFALAGLVDLGVIDVFFELDVDLFFGDVLTCDEDPEVVWVDVDFVEEEDLDFFVVDFFLSLDPGASL